MANKPQYSYHEQHRLRQVLRGLPRWQAYHETHFCPEVTSRDGWTYHIMDIEALRDHILAISPPRQREALGYWLQDCLEKDAAVAMGVPGQPVYMYVSAALSKALDRFMKEERPRLDRWAYLDAYGLAP